ncbi:fasciclin domain-containing protein [Ulvibacterium marinum]|uniref:fasciclin domain-containing protein n=1 Tax=Ulvibacterium marinum TaxID=2419782 RepID=UPI0024947FB9|nr:fasciclin domain-containing protein [Ulvibacterium marinum]
MKTTMIIERFLMVVLVSTCLLSCSKNDSPTPAPEPDAVLTIYGVISQEPDLSIFKEALDKLPVLRNQLDEKGILGNPDDEFTVFTPKNNAFEAFLLENGYDGIEAIDVTNQTDMDFLRTYIRNHIVIGTINASYLENEGNGYLITHVPENTNMFFSTSGGSTILNGKSKIMPLDKMATNGHVHVVDEVIPVPTLATFIESNSDFAAMQEALSLIEQGESTINEDLASAGEYTFFAPHNMAFENFYEEVELDNLEDLGPNILKYFVESHAIPNNIVDAQEIESAIGNTTINTINIALAVGKENDILTLTDTQNRLANMVTVDVRASNGILHIIDSVILGLGEPSPELDLTIYEITVQNSNLSTFAAALEKLPSLRDVLNDDSNVATLADEFTLFVPTDSAFNAFLLANGFDGIESVDMENQDHVDFLVTYVYNQITLETSTREMLESEGTGFRPTNTLEKIDMLFSASGGEIILNGVATVTSETSARNGMVYVVDNVIPVSTLATFIEYHPDFETMWQGLGIIENEVGSTIKFDLSTSPEYTMLVPTDLAFENLFDEINNNSGGNFTSIDQLGANIVEDIVEVHAIPFTEFKGSDIINTLGGTILTLTDELEVGIAGDNYTLTDPQGRTAILTKMDVRASNGLIHIIDGVLLGN